MATLKPRRVERGFTLIELLVVLAMFGLMLGLAALASRPDPQARLQRDAERLQVLFALAAEEAQLRARPIAWQADTQGYGFLLGGREGWTPLAGDDEFKPRAWEAGALRVTLSARQAGAGDRPGSWIEFPRDGAQPSFVLQLALAADQGEAAGWSVRGDGRGQYLIDPLP